MQYYEWARVTQDELDRIFRDTHRVEEEYQVQFGHDGGGRLLIYVPGLLAGEIIGEVVRESVGPLENVMAIDMDFAMLATPFDFRSGELIVVSQKYDYAGPVPLTEEERCAVGRTVLRECGRVMVVMADSLEGRRTVPVPWDSLVR